MKRIKFIAMLIFIIMMFTLFGCGPGLGEYGFPLPGNYKYESLSTHHSVIASKTSGKAIILPKVVEMGWDDHYILARQIGLKREDPNSPQQTPDPSVEYYWVLDVENTKRIGPFDKDDFDQQRKDLGISNDIELKPVSEYGRGIFDRSE